MSYNPLPEDVNSNVLVRLSQRDIFDQIIATNRNNQISTNFFAPNSNVNDYVLLNTTGGASAAMAAGKVVFQSGTATTSTLSAETFTNIVYTPGFEVYSIFTVTFTTPTSVNSSQLVGLWDVTSNGFYLGYDGTTFGTAVMTGGVQTFTSRASWNGDPLDGSATSKFTRNGVPEAINFNNSNLYRIRFGWLGVAPVLYEVISPDGNWITFNTILQPNTGPNPSIQNPNLPINLVITKASADSTNLVMNCSCWAGGTSAPQNVSVTNYARTIWTSSTSLNEELVTDTTGAGNISLSVIVTGTVSAGVITFEITPDGQNWFPLPINSPTGVFGSSTYNIVLGDTTLQSVVGGYAQARARLSTVITGAGSVAVELRPSQYPVVFNTQVYQQVGTNLHTVVDSGTITVTTSTTGNAPTAASVGVTSATAVASNASRKGLILTNTSNRTISFGLNGATAVLNSGITLLPGGIWVMDSYTFTTGAITAIASAAAANLAIQEMQ